MIPSRLTICAATLVLLSAASAGAEPAYVASTVNLRSGAGTGNEIVGKIPGGSLVEATNCSDWCEVEWQGRKGFAIASALDRSGRVRTPRAATRPAAPAPYYYGYGYRPYYSYGYGYRGYAYRGYGHRRGYYRR
jgi:uncharacterized protein YraI